MTFQWKLDRLPFIWAPLDDPNDGALPDVLPFVLGIDEATGRVIQVPDPKVDAALEAAYAAGSMIAGRMDEEGIGRRYADDFLSFIVANVDNVGGSRVLEIGSGTGYLMSRLNEMGADTVGIEPGDHGQDRFERPGVRLIRDFFPSAQVDGTFDVIVMYCVLEHVAVLDGWFEAIAGLLAPGGHLLISVPACEPFFEVGDLSVLVHEHFSYFTEGSLSDTLSAAGFGDHEIVDGGLGGSLYCVAQAGAGSSVPDLDRTEAETRRFREVAETSVGILRDYFTTTQEAGASVAVYVPLRAANFIVLGNAPIEHCRFFDDDPLQQGHYISGLDVVIEGQEALVSEPTDHVLIMSRAFGEQIKNRLVPVMPDGTRFTMVDELLDS